MDRASLFSAPAIGRFRRYLRGLCSRSRHPLNMTDRSVIVNEEEQANCRNGGAGLFHGHGGELALALLEGRRRARRGLGIVGAIAGLAHRETAQLARQFTPAARPRALGGCRYQETRRGPRPELPPRPRYAWR